MGSISTLNGTSLWRLYYSALIFGLSPRHWHFGEGVPKCVIFDVRSILWVQISSENFSLYTDPANSETGEIRVFDNFDANFLELQNGDMSDFLCASSRL